MELYTLSPTFQKTGIVERYSSAIWTERADELGDLKIIMDPSEGARQRLVEGTFIGGDETDEVMRIETTTLSNNDGASQLEISGVSFDAVFKGRVSAMDFADEQIDIYGSPGSVSRKLVYDICVNGVGISPLDIIPGLQATYVNSPTDVYGWYSIKPEPLFDTIQRLCRLDNLSFALTLPTVGVNSLLFRIYRGTDRSGYGGVFFSTDTQTLSDIKILNSISGSRNVAYVKGPASKNAIIGSQNSSGFNRKVVWADATNLDSPNANVDAVLRSVGLESLVLPTHLVDGKIAPSSREQYNKTFFLGDIVAIGTDVERVPMRVSEHIWSMTNVGERKYPAFSALSGG